MKIPGFSAGYSLKSSESDYREKSVSSYSSTSEVVPAAMCVRFRYYSPYWGSCDCVGCSGGRLSCVCSGGMQT